MDMVVNIAFIQGHKYEIKSMILFLVDRAKFHFRHVCYAVSILLAKRKGVNFGGYKKIYISNFPNMINILL